MVRKAQSHSQWMIDLFKNSPQGGPGPIGQHSRCKQHGLPPMLTVRVTGRRNCLIKPNQAPARNDSPTRESRFLERQLKQNLGSSLADLLIIENQQIDEVLGQSSIAGQRYGSDHIARDPDRQLLQDRPNRRVKGRFDTRKQMHFCLAQPMEVPQNRPQGLGTAGFYRCPTDQGQLRGFCPNQ